MAHSRDLFQSPILQIYTHNRMATSETLYPFQSQIVELILHPHFFFLLLCNVMQYACFSIILIQPYHFKWLAPHKCQYSQWITIHSQSTISYSHDICFISIPHSISNQHLYKGHTHVTKHISLKSYSITIYIYTSQHIYLPQTPYTTCLIYS